MPSYVADEQNKHIAQLSGTFTTDEANRVLTLGSDGEGDTLKTLPPGVEWLLVEVYDVEDVYGDIGFTKYQTKTTDLATILSDIRAIAIAEYTLFKIAAIHYKGNNTGDVYRGDETTALTLDSAGTSFTPPVATWKLSTNLTTPIHQVLICADSYECAMDWVCDP